MPILLTRPLEDSQALAETLEAEGIEAMTWPLTRITPAPTTPELPQTTGGLLFTSANGVRALAALTKRRDLPALCVSKATARAAQRAGFRDCRSADGDARALADLARRSGIHTFLRPRGHDTAGDLKGWLAETGQQVTEAILYRAEETGLPPAPIAAALSRAEIGLVTIWSPRGAVILANHLADGIANLGRSTLLAISPAAAAPLAESGFQHVLVAEAPNSVAMIAAIRSYSNNTRQ